ncbi:MAG: hypothetical protein WBW69_14490 [Candidatus Korobacteraceae bacterium]
MARTGHPAKEAQSAPFKIDPAKKDYYFEFDGEAKTQVLFKDERLTIDGPR